MFTSGKKWRNNAKNGIGKCKSERGTHDNCGKKWESTMQVEKRQKLQMEEKIENTWKEPMQAGRRRHDMWRI